MGFRLIPAAAPILTLVGAAIAVDGARVTVLSAGSAPAARIGAVLDAGRRTSGVVTLTKRGHRTSIIGQAAGSYRNRRNRAIRKRTRARRSLTRKDYANKMLNVA